MWVLLIPSLVVFFTVLLVAFSVFWLAQGAPNMTNDMIASADWIKAVFMKPTLGCWQFTPAPFDFVDTNRCFKVCFSPKHPRKHRLVLRFPCNGVAHLSHERSWIPPQRVSLQVAISCKGRCSCYEVEKILSICERTETGYEMTKWFFEFDVSKFPWRYQEPISICVKLNDKVPEQSPLYGVHATLFVEELHPHWGL